MLANELQRESRIGKNPSYGLVGEVKPTRRGRGDFTLIELLVVISIIMILMSILLPALRRARVVAKRSQAVSQAKQIMLAVTTYAGDADGFLPLPGGVPSDEYGGCTFWGNRLIDNGYLPLEETTTCSSSTNQIFWSPGHYPKCDTANMQDFLCFSGFGANVRGAFGNMHKGSTPPIRLSSTDATPSELVTLVDNSWDDGTLRESRYKAETEGKTLFSYAGWVPCAFLDGHATVHSGQEELGYRVTGERTGTWLEPMGSWNGAPWFNDNTN